MAFAIRDDDGIANTRQGGAQLFTLPNRFVQRSLSAAPRLPFSPAKHGQPGTYEDEKQQAGLLFETRYDEAVPGREQETCRRDRTENRGGQPRIESTEHRTRKDREKQSGEGEQIPKNRIQSKTDSDRDSDTDRGKCMPQRGRRRINLHGDPGQNRGR
ncbi:MAG: hypothetical protein U0744_21700 [Gemmataceae bacterium]